MLCQSQPVPWYVHTKRRYRGTSTSTPNGGTVVHPQLHAPVRARSGRRDEVAYRAPLAARSGGRRAAARERRPPGRVPRRCRVHPPGSLALRFIADEKNISEFSNMDRTWKCSLCFCARFYCAIKFIIPSDKKSYSCTVVQKKKAQL